MRWLIVGLLLCSPALAQENHPNGHAHYKKWENKSGRNCCNDQDCGTLKASDERTDHGRLEVRIEGTWCPILPHHYLRTGNAPDWNTSHVCVQRSAAWQIIPVCDRLLCYQPRPMF